MTIRLVCRFGFRRTEAACLIATLLMLGSVPAPADAQSEEPPSNAVAWYGYEGYHPFVAGEPWGLMLEGYIKRLNLMPDPANLFGRVGLDYKWSPKVWVTGGYAYQYNYPYDDASEPYRWSDHRIWQQGLFRFPYGAQKRSMLVHRARLEQRWLARSSEPTGTEPDHWKFEHTFRYMVRTNVSMTPVFSLALYDELHLRLAPADEAVLDQNRVYVGVVVYLDEAREWRFETGYMLQQVRHGDERDRRRTNHTWRVTITSDAPFSRRTP